ncbi:hypothetical protein [Tardiphaga sp.]|uniref:hypothetical protein n=1 Tax=Tardiphaga sp. TaxID=1926292 RepID=UPI002610DEAF|nr:hypothetical protein [Tardiphaga sp.]MDB5620552.1 hypothetical protein [Tardiphaga sp.]
MAKHTKLLELVTCCEAVSHGDRELDADIWLAVTPGATRNKTGYTHAASGKWCDIDETRDATGRLIVVPHYTSSLEAAATLIPDDFDWVLERTNGGLTICARVGHNDPDRSSWGNTPELALTAAALCARAASSITAGEA